MDDRTPTAGIIDHATRVRQPDLSARRWLAVWPFTQRRSAGLRLALPGPVSVTTSEVEAQAIRRLAVDVGHGRVLHREASVIRVWVGEVATTIGGQPQEGADESLRSVELEADHP
jgi:hypothetical protein